MSYKKAPQQSDGHDEDTTVLISWRQLNKLGLEIKKMLGDGNCLFRCFSDQLIDDQNEHTLYRNLAVEYIKTYPEIFEEFMSDNNKSLHVNSYVNKMSKSGVFGDHIEIQTLSFSLGLRIIVYELQQKPLIIEGNNMSIENTQVIRLAYNRTNLHYDSVINNRSNIMLEFS